MKELEELEEEFLNEVKPLVNQYIELKKQERNIATVMNCVDIKKSIQTKTDEFRRKYTKTMYEEYEKIDSEKKEIQKRLIEQRERLVKQRDKILEIHRAKETAKKEGDEKNYELLCLTEVEEKQKFGQMRRTYEEKIGIAKSYSEQATELGKKEEDFKEKYGDMDNVVESKIYRLEVFIGEKEKENAITMNRGELKDENGNEVIDIENAQEVQKRTDEQKEEEIKKIQDEAVQTVLNQKKQEFDEYLEQKMKELEESIDKELQEMEEEKQKELEETEIEQEKKEQDFPKQGRISKLWQRIKSFFKTKVVPALIEPIEQEEYTDLSEQTEKEENKDTNEFKERIAKESPSQQEQAKNTKGFIKRNRQKKSKKKEEKEIKEVLAMLDK